MTYPLDVRQKVLAFIDNGGTVFEAKKRFDISSCNTIYRWLNNGIEIYSDMKSRIVSEEELEWRKKIGAIFREAREEKQLRQNYVAQLMSIAPSILNRFEKGESTIPLYAFRKGCQVLGKDANYLLGRKRRKD